MRLISLNIWGGHVKKPLLKFIQTHQETDIFCFQEVYHKATSKTSTDDREVHLDIFSEIGVLLPHHQGFFRPVVNGSYGIGMFVHKRLPILDEGEVLIHEIPDYSGMGPAHSRNLQWVNCGAYTIINIHGLWNGKGKSDSPERLLQSQRIRSFLDTTQTPNILCGDFNLRPDTKSLQIIGQNMTNLIDHYAITSTRTHLYPKEEKFADYVFTSPEIPIHHFEVLPDIVSDHSPLLLISS